MNENNIEKYIDETEADDTIRYETMDAGDAADDDTAAADDIGKAAALGVPQGTLQPLLKKLK